MKIVDEWLRDIPQQFQGKHNIEILIQAFSRQMQELEDAFSDLMDKTNIDTAEGQNLDYVGTIIPLTRKEAGELAGIGDETPVISDEQYRRLLRYQNLVNTNECTYYDLMDGISLLWEKPPFIHYEERAERPATIFLNLPPYSLDDEDVVKGRKLAIKSAGVGLVYAVTYNGTIDESWLEQIKLQSITHAFSVPFWGYRALDGSWLLDGSVMLDAARRYNPKAAVETNVEVCCSATENMENFKLLTNSEDSWVLDGTYALDGTKFLDSKYKEEVL